jgi:hypothetical protein
MQDGSPLDHILWQMFVLVYVTQRVLYTPANRSRRVSILYDCDHSSVDLCLLTHVIYLFNVLRVLISNVSNESECDWHTKHVLGCRTFVVINPLAPDFFLILAHPVCKMLIIQEPKKVAL